MRLERLHVQGFKSFKDRTTIHFHDGITGIVGPNGCGKSNIVDALFWVMGEQSAKHLRGTKMSDLIFSGSNKYKPASLAEVSLVLLNETKKTIRVGKKMVSPSEIELTRKLFRNGETEYRINGVVARLRDIQEVFMDTGAGAKSYSIIAQGEIERLVRAKPVERRTIIEEVAGITKFKARKKESLRKIEQTEQNISRLIDLETEVLKNLKKLKDQAEKASRAKKLTERVEKLELTVESHKELGFLETIHRNESILKESEEKLELGQSEKQEILNKIETEEIERTELSDQLEIFQNQFNEVSSEISALEERIKNAKERRVELEDLVEKRNEEKEGLTERISTAKETLETAKQSLDDLEEERNTEGDDVDEGLDDFQEQLSNVEEEAQELKAVRDQTLDQVREKTAALELHRNKIEQVTRHIQEVTEQIDELEKKSGALIIGNDQDKERLSEVESQKRSLQENFQKLELERSNQLVVSEELSEQISLTKNKISRIEGEIQGLKRLLESQDLNTDNEELSEFIERTHGANSSALKVREAFSVSDEFSAAVDVALGAHYESLLSDNLSECVGWAANESKTIDVMQAKDNLSFIDQELQLEGVSLIPMIDKIEFTSNEASENLRGLLHGVYLVANSESFLKIIESGFPHGVRRIVTNDGKAMASLLNGIVQVQYGPAGENNGLMSAQTSLQKLEEEKLECEAKLADYLQKKEDLNLTALNEEIKKLEVDLNQSQLKEQELKIKIESFSGNIESEQQSLAKLETKKKEFSSDRIDLMEMEEALASEIDDLEEIKTQQEQSLHEKLDEKELVQEKYNEIKERIVEIETKKKTYDLRLEQATKTLENSREQLEYLDGREEQIQKEVEQASSDLELIQNELGENEETLSDKVELLRERRLKLSELKDEDETLLSSIRELEKRKNKLAQELAKHEKRVVESSVKIDQAIDNEIFLVRDFWERKQINLRLAVLKASEELTELDSLKNLDFADEQDLNNLNTDYEFQKKFPGQLKEAKEKLRSAKAELGRLGQINWQAIEDCEDYQKRADFLSAQKEELTSSLDDLRQAMDSIDEKSKIRFQESFNAVNDKFSKVFPIIFGGGEARLNLVGNFEDPEAGVDIIAKPPGKRMQNINLMSGGEKAMTAVSLIFSIFLVKPSPFCFLDEVDAPLDDANVGRFNELLREMSSESQFVLITHNKRTMELNDKLYGVTMEEPGVSKVLSVTLH